MCSVLYNHIRGHSPCSKSLQSEQPIPNNILRLQFASLIHFGMIFDLELSSSHTSYVRRWPSSYFLYLSLQQFLCAFIAPLF